MTTLYRLRMLTQNFRFSRYVEVSIENAHNKYFWRWKPLITYKCLLRIYVALDMLRSLLKMHKTKYFWRWKLLILYECLLRIYVVLYLYIYIYVMVIIDKTHNTPHTMFMGATYR